jgi:hypothetical protein
LQKKKLSKSKSVVVIAVTLMLSAQDDVKNKKESKRLSQQYNLMVELLSVHY